MISRITGELIGVVNGQVELRCGTITYAIRIPAFDEERLETALGREIEFHTLYYLEGQGQGTSFVPRLIGFASAEARAFFELLTTVKGLGSRRALRALRMPYHSIAEAIVNKDVELLTTLPEIGRRTAETIVAELSGKVDRFAGPEPAQAGEPAVVHDALLALVQLGEPKIRARRLVAQALAEDPTLETADALVAAAYRVKDA